MEKTYKITKLVVCIILMCASLGTALYFAITPFINVKTNYNIASPNSMNLHIDGIYKKSINSTDDNYNKILELFNDSFIVSKSDLIFGNEVIKDAKLLNSKQLDKSKGVYLEFSYNESQTLTVGYSTVTYNNITIEITDTTNMKITNAYLVDKSDLTPGITYKYTTYSKMHNLYQYLQDLV